ncbi:hypothetical protein B5C34_14810 [Pacificimonas flava]|uniref:DUF2141 domain-containing protein n=2 Tax=Pacificimonas TaxID=1960290 RepID=A0A219B1U1_9SPHN|nr:MULTISPECIES: DUF2141 domain-containing protein [Pacificimonas]MBZ6379766.1 DUF2141 domain-containing protein [Pacificimonas aurantium]OWV31779.1 hypothetical protein B5C34_14810 [Pacificimonas flava]
MGLAPAPGPNPAPPRPSDLADATLHLTVEGLRAPRGTLRLCVWDSAEGFPECKPGVNARRIAVKAADETVELDIESLHSGSYGISIIHDENDNRRLDKALFGLPTEGVGFSNDASAPFGPPSFRRVRFDVAGDTAQTIRLKYYL